MTLALSRLGSKPTDVVDIGSASLGSLAASRLRALCDAAGFGAETERSVSILRSLTEPWFNVAPDHYAAWPTEISDDNTPIEFSVAIAGERADVRILLEPQAEQPEIKAYRRAAIDFHQRIEREFGASLARFRLISDLFLPEDMQGPFALWSSVVFSRGKPPAFKAYFNPQARGVGNAPALVEEALCRLGFSKAWNALSQSVVRRGPDRDELKYLALDLSDEREARVKVYVRHHGVTPQELENMGPISTTHVPGEALSFIDAMGGSAARLIPRAAATCSAFDGSEEERPKALTVYVPVCAYAENDAVVRDRVTTYLASRRVRSELYTRVLQSFASRPLQDGVGMHSWVALRSGAREPRLTLYLATEARRIFEPGSVPARTPDLMHIQSVDELVARLQTHSLALHPLFTRLRRAGDVEFEATVRRELLDELGAVGADLSDVGARIAMHVLRSQLDGTPLPAAEAVLPSAIAQVRRGGMLLHNKLWCRCDEYYARHCVRD